MKKILFISLCIFSSITIQAFKVKFLRDSSFPKLAKFHYSFEESDNRWCTWSTKKLSFSQTDAISREIPNGVYPFILVQITSNKYKTASLEIQSDKEPSVIFIIGVNKGKITIRKTTM